LFNFRLCDILGRGRDPGDIFVQFPALPLDRFFNQGQDILRPIAQGREHNLDHVQPVKQVIPECMVGDFAFQVLIRGRDYPHVGFDRVVPA